MNIVKRLSALILCLIICLSFGVNVFAEAVTPTISLSDVSAMPNDTVTIDVDIKDNPGIMGMAFSVTYDSDAFEYVEYTNGWLSGMTVKDHSDKGHVIFVYVATGNKTDVGKMLSVSFKIKEKATPGKHTITLANNNREKYGNKLHNSFSNSKQEYIIPSVKAGSITVGETCINAGHKYGDWTITKPANCTETGLKNHTCSRCEFNEEVDIPITHDFEEDWTVDEVATPDKDGVMTRHCKLCDETTDRIIFSYQEVGGNDEPTTSETSSNDSSDESGTTSSDASSVESNTTQDSPSSSESNNTSKPVIDNTVGGKVPADVVVNLNGYQQNVKPNYEPAPSPDDTESSSNDQSSSAESIPDVQNKPDVQPATPQYSNSFFATPTGIAVAVISALLSVGIIGLGIFLIIKNKS